MAHVEDAPADFTGDRKGLDQKVDYGLAVSDALLEIDGLGGEFGVGELLKSGLQIIDGGNDRTHLLDIAFVLGPENFRKDGIEHCGGLLLFYTFRTRPSCLRLRRRYFRRQ